MKREQKSMGNKGFSLVELIIVIAIMAILVAVLAPQYLKYVERSRNSTDKDNATAIENALLVWGSETEIPAGETGYVGGKSATVTVDGTNLTVGGENSAAALSALKNAGLITESPSTAVKCQSKTAWTSYVVTVTVDAQGVVKTSNNFPTASGS